MNEELLNKLKIYLNDKYFHLGMDNISISAMEDIGSIFIQGIGWEEMRADMLSFLQEHTNAFETDYANVGVRIICFYDDKYKDEIENNKEHAKYWMWQEVSQRVVESYYKPKYGIVNFKNSYHFNLDAKSHSKFSFYILRTRGSEISGDRRVECEGKVRDLEWHEIDEAQVQVDSIPLADIIEKLVSLSEEEIPFATYRSIYDDLKTKAENINIDALASIYPEGGLNDNLK